MVNSADKIIAVGFTKADWELLWQLSEEANQDHFNHNLRTPPTTRVKRVALMCAGDTMVALGLAQSQWMTSKLDTRVRFSSVRELDTPLGLDELYATLPAKLRHYAEGAFGSSGVLPPTSGDAVLAAPRRLRPEADAILQILFDARSSSELATTAHRRQLLLEQRDALALGLEAAGLDSKAALKKWEDPSGDAPFMLGLSESATSEAALIRHDLNHLDEWTNLGGAIHDVIEFRDPRDDHRKVTVIYADKEPLEEQLGTDLVYYRHNNPGYVAVQYKRLKSEPTKGDPLKSVYRPDDQMKEEIERMRKVSTPGNALKIENWRLSPEPFYVKLCDGLMSRPENNRLVPGMYFPLGLFEMLLESPQILGPNGGKAIGWHNAERYLSNGEFVELLKHGWIGSVGPATDVITNVVRSSLERKRSVTLVIDQTDPARAKKLRRR